MIVTMMPKISKSKLKDKNLIKKMKKANSMQNSKEPF